MDATTRLEIVQVTTLFPMVFVIAAGSLDLHTLSAAVIARLHIDDAKALVAANNNRLDIKNNT